MSRNAWIWIILGFALLTGGVAVVSVSPSIRKIGEAIAIAEGFYVEGSIPARNLNPGDLTKDLTGKGIGFEGPFVKYATAQDGFEALYKQISEILGGTSGIYNPNWSIKQIAQRYSPDGWMEWAHNVSTYLGVSMDTPLNEIV